MRQDPFAVFITAPVTNTFNSRNVDDLSTFAPWYTYMRGGIIYRAFNKDGVSRITLHAPAFSGIPARGANLPPAVGQVFEKREICSAYIPQYSCGYARPIGYSSETLGDFAGEAPTVTVDSYDTAGAAIANIRQSRVVSDEFQLLGFSGVPLMLLTPDNTVSGAIFP